MKGAVDICENKGMMVFEPRDATINRKVWQALKNDGLYWLNLKRKNPESQFKYVSDGSQPNYTHWAPGTKIY